MGIVPAYVKVAGFKPHRVHTHARRDLFLGKELTRGKRESVSQTEFDGNRRA